MTVFTSRGSIAVCPSLGTWKERSNPDQLRPLGSCEMRTSFNRCPFRQWQVRKKPELLRTNYAVSKQLEPLVCALEQLAEEKGPQLVEGCTGQPQPAHRHPSGLSERVQSSARWLTVSGSGRSNIDVRVLVSKVSKQRDKEIAGGL